MKNKMFLRLFLAAGVATILAACTSESENGPSANISYESIAATQQVPVTFGTYIGETPITRAYMDDAQLQTSGFGVFAYYSDDEEYPEDWTDANPANWTDNSTLSPNFMYNQRVTYSAGNWGYIPVKYWPNETDDDKQTPPAENPDSNIDRLSFFAYAPYNVYGTYAATGITGLTANDATSDPKVTYTTGTTLNEQDLVWGVANPASNVTWNTVSTTVPTVTINAGTPFKNLIKPSTAQKVQFHFRHALAALDLKVLGVFDEQAPGTPTPNTIADNTYITIESITVTATLPTSGVLNLNNKAASTPLWESNATTEAKVFSITNASGLVDNLQYNVSADAPYGAETGTPVKPGVGRDATTGTASSALQDVIAKASTKPQYFMFVPPAQTTATEDDIIFTVKIKYHVWTYDTALDGNFSKVVNEIQKAITINNVAGGNIYTIKMLLGMTSVKLEGQVTPWADGSTNEIDLPQNVEPAP